MRPNASGVVLLLSSLSLVQAAAHRRDAFLGRTLGARADGDVEKRQAAGAQTVTVLQTVTVGAAGAGAVVNNTVTVTAAASTVTITACPSPGLANGAADPAASVSVPNAGAVGAPPGAAQPGGQDTPSGGIGVVIIDIPASLRKTTGGGAAPTAPPVASAPVASAPAASVVAPSAGAPVVQNPAASDLAPLPTAPPAAGSSLAPLPGAASSLAPLPGAGSSLAPLPGAGSSSSLAALPSAGSSAALPSSPALAPLPTVASPAAPLQSTVDLGNVQIPGGVVGGADPTPVGADGAFGGEVGTVPLSGAPGAPAQAATDPSVTVAPDVAAGAQLINIDVSNLSLNSQLNLGNLVQATPVAAAP
ncbi:hypothetical protein B0T16DRAFT_452723 [Cercophora newfieldiana]|uniref:Uncharacterized protein n=1 Tax=Cercophora newfieldiana TaxID=92897 RepID=A0AA39YTP7_9PEZI|nr:hypothetical protein B0T16DRAFT_452723 [Cercophora newfieldiana]